MTDNEIIKALECCTTKGASCRNCPAFEKVDRSNCKQFFVGALSLINRQKAEVERLNGYINTNCLDCAGCKQWKCDCANIKAEAIKEFCEKRGIEYVETDI
jgi:hypothetical protein